MRTFALAAILLVSCGESDTRPAMGGDVTVLEARSGPGGTIPVAWTADDLDRMVGFYVDKNIEEVKLMAAQGRVAFIKAGTSCRVIDPGIATYEVRILEGPHEGKSCFATTECVKRLPKVKLQSR